MLGSVRHEESAKGEGMGEAPGGGGGRTELERKLIDRSLEDEGFRRRLLDDPKEAVEQELGSRLPEGVEVRAVEETADTVYLVLPSATPIGGGGELSDGELRTVAGGADAPFDGGWGSAGCPTSGCDA